MDVVASCWDSGMVEPPHKQVPAPFLTKTYQLVDDPATDHIVSWGDDDRLSTFVVWRPPEFARDILPSFFKHNNFSSFVRQLNTYGFRKVVPEKWEFANDFFRKGEKHLLCEIHRRKSAAASPSLSFPPPPALFPLYPHQRFDEQHLPPGASPRFLLLGSGGGIGDTVIAAGGGGTAAVLLEENERLRRNNTALLSELAHMRRLYNDIIYFVQNHVAPVAPSSAAAASASFLLSGPAAGCSNQRRVAAAINSGGSTTSSSSLTIVEEAPSPPSNGSESSSARPKLFGVALDGCRSSSASINSKRGLLQAESPSSALTKPRLVLQEMDLDVNVTPPPPSPLHC